MTLTRKYLLLRSVFLISCLLNSPHCFSILFLNKDFPTTNKISDNIYFWEKIFEHYDSNQAVIHDRNNPKLVIDIINFKEFNNTQLSFEKITHAYLKRYNLALKRFRQLKIKAQKQITKVTEFA